MTDQEINEAIAKASKIPISEWKPHLEPCGKGHRCCRCGEFTLSKELWPICKKPNQKLPNYCTDLNAMHEAEALLNPDQWMEYEREIARAAYNVTSGSWSRVVMSSTARQRADAFLRTFGLWREK